MNDVEQQVAIYEHANGHIRIIKRQKVRKGRKILLRITYIYHVQYKATDIDNWSGICIFKNGTQYKEYTEIGASLQFNRMKKTLDKGTIIKAR